MDKLTNISSFARASHQAFNPKVKTGTDAKRLKEFSNSLHALLNDPTHPVEHRAVSCIHLACAMLGLDYGFITRIDSYGAVFRIIGADRIEQRDNIMARADHSLTREIIRQRAPVLREGKLSGSHAESTDLTGAIPKWFIGVPVLINREIIGSIEFSGRHRDTAFASYDISATEILAATLSVALSGMTNQAE